MAYKRNDHRGNYDHDSNSSNSSDPDSTYAVPYKDAKPDSSEVPLDELDNFIVPGRDEHGAHQTITCNMPPILVHQIDVVVRSQLFPYINREAFLRHAQVRHLRWLQNIRPEQLSQHIAPTIESMLERCFQSQMRKKVQAAFDALRETLLQCEKDGEWLEVMRLCYYVKEKLTAVDPGSVWQKRAWKRFMDEFGHYMQEASYVMQKASMLDKGLGKGDERLDAELMGRTLPAPVQVHGHVVDTTKRLRIRNEPSEFDEVVN